MEPGSRQEVQEPVNDCPAQRTGARASQLGKTKDRE